MSSKRLKDYLIYDLIFLVLIEQALEIFIDIEYSKRNLLKNSMLK